MSDLTLALPPLALPPELVELAAQRAAELIEAKLPARVPAGPEPFLDVAGAADFLACPKSRVYSLVNVRRIPFHKEGSRLLFRASELDEFVRAGGARRP